MTLTLYNTLTRRKETFTTVETDKVRMYCCGITVYDLCHLGHARTCIIWDTARRYLEWRGYEVNYVQNFTDIDDKILNRARQEGTSMVDVSERFIQAYFEDMARLNVAQANAYPRATHTLDGIKRLIHELEQKGYAYPSAGDVYYGVRNFAEYGKLSGRKLEDLQVGASGRVEVEDPESAKKKDPFDFALWKGAKSGEPAWESPWGNGRPGWHIECSAMIRDNLGETIDIHAGGADLIFPHHENEIAQSEAVTGKPLANYWLHTGMVKVGGEKMSKSLGNFITIRDLLDRPTDAMAVRLFILQAQYRKPLDFTEDAIEATTNGWHTLKEGLLFGYKHGKKLGWQISTTTPDRAKHSDINIPINQTSYPPNARLRHASLTPLHPTSQSPLPTPYIQRFKEAVDDDFNFAGGLAVLFELAKDLVKEGNLLIHEGKTETPPEELENQWQTLVTLADVLGFVAEPEEEVEAIDGLSDAEIETLIQQRLEARKAKNFAEGDRIRNELQAQGVTLIDKPGGVTIWHRG
ncbi:MAG TPA: cysteine--tRNA ligase [Cyanobacteria bacterium UBA11149]|nr:cysteine--tRNA ligase [Cyanobacteria bacterium UBA11367]HBE58371.1 cysteine--tRNA ligase [Cyanobacteria bacterium UBA11366]HBK62845.1 cysteine--tRNA ligase [Cyanobacteria bacterium UBA11166]HBR73183.1 cysteine--tRNA ligase [Cyanobacteria bacterium UBA11159]HBS69659.1 cysteine--tRNA ligase [Cyanobacteria bacterium UBA11153]HBW91754.1 cysteine--tRNA ligase [Cyanobacteria bacterium UBA11149]HCA95346.1 cysteine--tRNA ligase [Cyanobacteria bacterium UBA9226]